MPGEVHAKAARMVYPEVVVMMGTQCDNCRTFAPSTPAGWFVLARIEAPAHSGFAALFGSGASSQPDSPATFCSAQCVADYACVLAVTGSTGSPS